MSAHSRHIKLKMLKYICNVPRENDDTNDEGLNFIVHRSKIMVLPLKKGAILSFIAHFFSLFERYTAHQKSNNLNGIWL